MTIMTLGLHPTKIYTTHEVKMNFYINDSHFVKYNFSIYHLNIFTKEPEKEVHYWLSKAA